MAIGAGMGAMAANERRHQMIARQQQTANAAADAIQASYGRKDGKGVIPGVEYAGGSTAGDLLHGSTAGAMQGYAASQSDMFSNKGIMPGAQPRQYNLGANTQLPDYSFGEGVDFMKLKSQAPAQADPYGFGQGSKLASLYNRPMR
jgi:hypothetical protein